MLNDIKSNFILKIIFEYIKRKQKLKIIKYNNRILNKLNITSKDFEIYSLNNKLLKEFNNKYYKYKRY